MFQATQVICDEFDKAGVKYTVRELENRSLVSVSFSVKGGPHLDVLFISRDDDNDVAVRVFNIVNVPEDKRDSVLRIINQASIDYRYACFFLQKDGNVGAQYDLPVKGAAVGPVCVEILVRLMKIVENVYPNLMKCLWA